MTNGKYDDIINMERPVSRKHPKMSMHDRAAQFAPFAALTGHKESIAESGRVTEERIVLDENEKAELDCSLQYLLQLGRGTEIFMICFEKDERKRGGRYVDVKGRFRKLDEDRKKLILEDGSAYSLSNIYQIRIENPEE